MYDMYRPKTLDDFPDLKKHIVDIGKRDNYYKVETAFKTGTILLKLKSYIKRGEWMSFMNSNFIMSDRSCQHYMRISKNNVHKKYWHLGLHEILQRLTDEKDLTK